MTFLGYEQGQSGSRALALNHSLCLDARVLKALEVTDPSKHPLQTPRSFPRKVHTFNFAFHLSGSHRGYLSLPAWVLSHFSWVQLSMDHSPPGSSVHGIFQARTLEWAAMSSSRGSSQPRDQTRVSCISCTDRSVLYH